MDGNSAVVEASDGGQISVQLIGNGASGISLFKIIVLLFEQAESISETTYVEVIGNVIDNTTIRMLHCIKLGQDFGGLSSRC